MRKIILYSLLLGAALLYPVQEEDVGKLLPVELIQLYKQGDEVEISTDAGAAGTGATVKEAIEDMKASASGIVFLDTADYLLIRNAEDNQIEELKEYLKATIRICYLDTETDLKEAAAYLRVHKPRQRLKDIAEQSHEEILLKEESRLILKEK